jgi:hypothetical protein
MAKRLKLPAVDPAELAEQRGTIYPSPFKEKVAGRAKRRLGDAAGLTQFGVNLVSLPPGVYSSMCPSSNDLRLAGAFSNGGSGSSGLSV